MAGTHHFLTDERFAVSPLHRLDPRAKIAGFLVLTIVCVSTPARAVWAFALYAGILLFLLGLSRLPLGYVFRRSLVVLPFILVVAVFLPFFRGNDAGYDLGWLHVSTAGLLVLWNVVAKATLGVLSMIILISTTSFPELIAGLEGLRTPRILTLIASFMYRYSFLLVEELGRMRRAMVSRNYRGRWLWDAGMLGHLVSALFLRSYARAERVYLAMVSRGYEGTMHLSAPLAFRWLDAVFLGSLVGTVLSIRVVAML